MEIYDNSARVRSSCNVLIPCWPLHRLSFSDFGVPARPVAPPLKSEIDEVDDDDDDEFSEVCT